MEELNPNETSIEGKWNFDGSSMNSDDSCKRIEWLINNKLIEISVNGDDWETVYQDPEDRRYWLLSYPQSQMHGGGPPYLAVISEKEAQVKFDV